MEAPSDHRCMENHLTKETEAQEGGSQGYVDSKWQTGSQDVNVLTAEVKQGDGFYLESNFLLSQKGLTRMPA